MILNRRAHKFTSAVFVVVLKHVAMLSKDSFAHCLAAFCKKIKINLIGLLCCPLPPLISSKHLNTSDSILGEFLLKYSLRVFNQYALNYENPWLKKS
jgi:hypothetical protein